MSLGYKENLQLTIPNYYYCINESVQKSFFVQQGFLL